MHLVSYDIILERGANFSNRLQLLLDSRNLELSRDVKGYFLISLPRVTLHSSEKATLSSTCLVDKLRSTWRFKLKSSRLPRFVLCWEPVG